MTHNWTFNPHDLGPLVFLAVFAVSLYFGIQRSKARKQKLKQIAMRLGLQYQEKSDWQASPAAAPTAGGQQQQAQQRARQLQQNGTLAKVMSLLSTAAITGSYNGWPVDIRTVNENKTSYTKFRLDFGRPLGLGLRVSANSFFQRDLFGGSPRIESGNEEFDKKVLVRGSNELKVKFLVKRPETQRALLDAYRAYSEIAVDDEGISCKLRGFVDDYQRYQAILTALTAVAAALAPRQSEAPAEVGSYR